MAGGGSRPEHQVICHPPQPDGRGDERLRFAVDGREKSAGLHIGALSDQLVANLPDLVIDLLEVATFVYAIDASVSRGGPVDARMGSAWHRRFAVKCPVRCPEIWGREDVCRALEAMLMALSGDRFRFEFVPNPHHATANCYFDLGTETGWVPDAVLLFSGGLDSFAGALEEIVERKNRVALISHHSSTKIAKVQRALQAVMQKRLGKPMLMHVPTRVKLGKITNAEASHRTRSFLFAALGMATAIAFGQKRVSFYENGVVSLNLPPVTHVIGTRATRSTHPQSLTRFSELFELLFGPGHRVDNPFFWRTKVDVVKKIAALGMGDQIPHTRSCADVHNLTKQHSHCGRCSQCIDRRFAMIAAGLQDIDPAEAYRVDLMTGPRVKTQDREMVLSYVRNAQTLELLEPQELQHAYPDINRAVAHLGEPPRVAFDRLAKFLQRHGRGVMNVMRATMQKIPASDVGPDTLPGLYGNLEKVRALQALSAEKPDSTPETEKPILHLHVDKARKLVTIDKIMEIGGATSGLLRELADAYLGGAGQGLDPLEYPMLSAANLAKRLGLADEASVRKRVYRCRSILRGKFESAGLDPELANALIETSPWHGYRLAPDRVHVTLEKKVKTAR